MTLLRRHFLHLAAAAAAVSASPRWAMALDFPTRPVEIIVPLDRGSSVDAIGRLLADSMKASLGQPAFVVNVPGAGGTMGVSRVARAAPDGYTIDLGQWATHVVNGAIYSLTYDLANDFAAVGLISSDPFVIAAAKATPADDLRSLVAWLKANPDKASQAFLDPGQQAVGALFQKQTGTGFHSLSYRNAGPQAMQDVAAGKVDLVIAPSAVLRGYILTGAVKAYAVMANRRCAAVPDIPTVDEAGAPGLHASSWFGIFAPSGTPAPVIGKLNAALVAALADPKVQSQLTDFGQEIVPPEQRTPEALAAFQKAEVEKWWPVIRAARIRSQ